MWTFLNDNRFERQPTIMNSMNYGFCRNRESKNEMLGQNFGCIENEIAMLECELDKGGY